MAAVFEVAAFLVVLVGALIWRHWSYTREPVRFVIAVGQSRWRTRPCLMRVAGDKALVGTVVHSFEEAGLASPKVILFQGYPTMDLLFEPDQSETTRSQLSEIVRGLPVRIETLRGERMPLRYH